GVQVSGTPTTPRQHGSAPTIPTPLRPRKPPLLRSKVEKRSAALISVWFCVRPMPLPVEWLMLIQANRSQACSSVTDKQPVEAMEAMESTGAGGMVAMVQIGAMRVMEAIGVL